MPVKIYRRKGSDIYHFRGTVAGHRLRGTTKTANKETAARVAAEAESREWKRHLDGPSAVLTFAQAAALYEAAGKSMRFVDVVEDYWKDTIVKDIRAGAIRQGAIERYPSGAAATRNRQFIVPTQAIINHCADMELCPPIRVRRFTVVKQVRPYTDLEWVQQFVATAERRGMRHLGALCLFMFLTGARVGQAVKVFPKHLDLPGERTSLIPTSKNRPWRVAHLPDPLFVALANLALDPTKPVFGYKTRGAAYGAWKVNCRHAGLPYKAFHATRHGFATGMLRKKIDPVTIAKRGGWANPRQIWETYGHEMEDQTVTDVLLSGTELTQQDSEQAIIGKKTKAS